MIAGRPLQAWLDRADALCAEGRFFEAHEELEIAWKAASGGEKTLLQGVIQLAAGLHRLRTSPGRREGAAYLLERGLKKLRAQAALLERQSVDELASRIKTLFDGPAPATFRLGLRAALSAR